MPTIDHRKRHLRRLVANLDARILEGMTATEDVPDHVLRDMGMLDAARVVALRLLDEVEALGRPEGRPYAKAP
jgi:hypothetical protein